MVGTYFTSFKLQYSLFTTEYEKIGKVYLFENFSCQQNQKLGSLWIAIFLLLKKLQ